MSFKKSSSLFFIMFSLFLVLNLNFTILRSLRNTLTVVDLGSGAHTIPLFELFGAMPGAFLMTALLSWLLSRFSMKNVFLITMTTFLGFYLLFSTLFYPLLQQWKTYGEWGIFVVHCFTMVFYVMCELWKPALAIILFFGLVNQYLPLEEGKKFYAPLMLGGSLGSIVAGPIISFSTHEKVWHFFPFADQLWTHGLNIMILTIVFFGIVALFLYNRLWHLFQQLPSVTNTRKEKTAMPLKECISTALESSQLRFLSWIVIADYIAYSLGEVIFLEVLKMQYPLSADYSYYMGWLAFWSGILTLISSLFITPLILQKCRWEIAALATPICLLITEGFFFLLLRSQMMSQFMFGWSEAEWLMGIIILGSVQYCVCRAAKYTLFDSSKELAYVLIPESQRMKGKLVVDGLCARIGRGGASLLNLSIIYLFGGVLASSLVTGCIALGAVASWIVSVKKLGNLFVRKNSVEIKNV